jgi:hypothetical protein
MRLLLAFLALAVGCAGGSTVTAAPDNVVPPAASVECHVDGDCACGRDKETHNCAFGPASRIDATQQCPDFCAGIDGRRRTVCSQGTCQQVRR